MKPDALEGRRPPGRSAAAPALVPPPRPPGLPAAATPLAGLCSAWPADPRRRAGAALRALLPSAAGRPAESLRRCRRKPPKSGMQEGERWRVVSEPLEHSVRSRGGGGGTLPAAPSEPPQALLSPSALLKLHCRMKAWRPGGPRCGTEAVRFCTAAAPSSAACPACACTAMCTLLLPPASPLDGLPPATGGAALPPQSRATRAAYRGCRTGGELLPEAGGAGGGTNATGPAAAVGEAAARGGCGLLCGWPCGRPGGEAGGLQQPRLDEQSEPGSSATTARPSSSPAATSTKAEQVPAAGVGSPVPGQQRMLAGGGEAGMPLHLLSCVALVPEPGSCGATARPSSSPTPKSPSLELGGSCCPRLPG